MYVGLTDEEALRLASRHNINGHYNHKMTQKLRKSIKMTIILNLSGIIASIV